MWGHWQWHWHVAHVPTQALGHRALKMTETHSQVAYITPAGDHIRDVAGKVHISRIWSATQGTYLQFTIPGISRCLEYSRRLPLLFWRHILLCCALRSAPQRELISPGYQYMQEVSAAYSDSGIQEGVISSLSPCLYVSLLQVTVYQ